MARSMGIASCIAWIIGGPAHAEVLYIESFFQFEQWVSAPGDQVCVLEFERKKSGELRLLPNTECRNLRLSVERLTDGRWAVRSSSPYPRDESYRQLFFQYQLKEASGKTRSSGVEVFPTPNFQNDEQLYFVQADELLRDKPRLRIPCKKVSHFLVSGNYGSGRPVLSLKVGLESEKIERFGIGWETWVGFSQSYADLEKRQVRMNDSIYIDDVRQDRVLNSCTGQPLAEVERP